VNNFFCIDNFFDNFFAYMLYLCPPQGRKLDRNIKK